MDTPTTQAPYEIARYLSDEAKRAAVARSYAPTHPSVGYTSPRCESGMCPLGVVLLVMTGELTPAPSAQQLARTIGPWDGWHAFDRFMEDWDRGRIADLPAALGVS